MRTIKYMGRLFGELCGYAWQNKTWWLIPLVLILVAFGVLIGASQTALPFIYTIF